MLQSLKFTLLVHHPIRALYGFFLDFQAVLLHPEQVMYDVSRYLGTCIIKQRNGSISILWSAMAFCLRRRRLHLQQCTILIKDFDKYLRRKYLSNEEKLDPIKEQENENENKMAKINL